MNGRYTYIRAKGRYFGKLNEIKVAASLGFFYGAAVSKNSEHASICVALADFEEAAPLCKSSCIERKEQREQYETAP
jgi:hypothetical protein